MNPSTNHLDPEQLERLYSLARASVVPPDTAAQIKEARALLNEIDEERKKKEAEWRDRARKARGDLGLALGAKGRADMARAEIRGRYVPREVILKAEKASSDVRLAKIKAERARRDLAETRRTARITKEQRAKDKEYDEQVARRLVNAEARVSEAIDELDRLESIATEAEAIEEQWLEFLLSATGAPS